MPKIEVSSETYAHLSALYTRIVTNNDFATPNWLTENRIPLTSARLLVTQKIATECGITGTISRVRHTVPPALTDVFVMSPAAYL